MGDEHRCEWRDRAEALQQQLDQAHAVIGTLTQQVADATAVMGSMRGQITGLQDSLEKLQRHVFGQRSEKIPPVAQAIRDPAQAEAARISANQKRRENTEKKRQLVTRRIEHKVREDQKICPKRRPRLHAARRRHADRDLRARPGQGRAPAARPGEAPVSLRRGDHHRRGARPRLRQGTLRSDFMAQIAVSKCTDSLPLHR